MNILIFDQLGCYASVAAAAYLTGRISENPSVSEISRLPYFGAHRDLQVGGIYNIGNNKNDDILHCMGTGRESWLMMTAAGDLLRLLGKEENILLVDVSKFNSGLVRAMSVIKLITPLQRIAVFLAARSLARIFPEMVGILKE